MDPGEVDPTGRFKQAAGRFASGVTVVTTRNGRYVYGITCSSFVSLSLNPLLVTVSINSASPFLDEVRASGRLAVSVLAADQQHVSRYFATPGRGRAKHEFPGVETAVVETGAPIVTGCLSWFDARLHAILPGGDHKILIGLVTAAGGGDGQPLLYWAGRYRQLDADDRIGQFADTISVHLHLSNLTPTELLEAQDALEPAAGHLAALRRHGDSLVALNQALVESRLAADDPEKFTDAAMRFHDALGPASRNPLLAAALQALGRSRRAHYAGGTSPETIARTIQAHQQIFEAIVAGDAEAARDLLARHIAFVGGRLCRDE